MSTEDKKTITVTLHLHPLLRPYASCRSGDQAGRLSVPAGTTVGGIVRDICGLPADIQVFAAVNGRSSPFSGELHDGDIVNLFMAAGGG